MPSKYEILASVIKREHDNLEDEGGYIDDGSWGVLIDVLAILHEAEEGPRPGGPNNSIDWAKAAGEIFELLAHAHNVIDFSQPYPYERKVVLSGDEREEEVTTAREFIHDTRVDRVGGSDELDFGGGDTE